MSDRAMRVALVAIREITEDARILTIVEEALADRREGATGPLSPAEKQRRYRERQAGRRLASEAASGNERDPMLPGVTEPVTEGVTAAVTVAAPPDPPEIPSDSGNLVPSERGSETRVRAAGATGVTEPVTAGVTTAVTRHPPNATADGAGGLAVTSWQAGVTSVTKRPISVTGGQAGELGAALRKGLEDDSTRTGKAFEVGAAFARYALTKPCTVSVLKFLDWYATPEPAKAPTPGESPAVLEERARRNRDRRDAETNAAPPTAEALALARGRPLAKAGS